MLQLQWHWFNPPEGHWTFPCRVNRVASVKFKHNTAATDRTPNPTCGGMARKKDTAVFHSALSFLVSSALSHARGLYVAN